MLCTNLFFLRGSLLNTNTRVGPLGLFHRTALLVEAKEEEEEEEHTGFCKCPTNAGPEPYISG